MQKVLNYGCLACKWSRLFDGDERVYCRNFDCKTYPYGIKDECSCFHYEKRKEKDLINERW